MARHRAVADNFLGSRQMQPSFMFRGLHFSSNRDPSKTFVTDQPATGEMEWPNFSIPDLYYKELSLDIPVGRGVKADECAFWGIFLEDLRLTLGKYTTYIFVCRRKTVGYLLQTILHMSFLF